MRVCGHFFFGAPIQYGDALGPQAACHCGAVNSSVSRADDDYIAADAELRGLEFAAFDVFESVKYVLFAGNSQLRRIAETYTNEHRVIIFLQVGDSGIDAHFLAKFKPGTETLDHRDFRKRNFHRLA